MSSPKQAKVRTRDRMLLSAVTLLRESGPNGVTLDAVLTRSGAPRGSIYHHFPGGRDQLVLEAAQLGADYIGGMIEHVGADAEHAIELFVGFWREALTASDFRAGCPVASLVVGGQDRPQTDALARDTFAAWSEALASMLRRRGVPASDAPRLASASISAIEGAVILCRVQRSAQPLDDVATLLREHLALVTRD